MPSLPLRFGFFLAAALASFAAAAGQACEAESGETRAALLELYTSEGCNSCPPADRWLAALPQRGFDQTRIVPLAFHVDYWDYLGWRDPFAQRAFTDRQQEFARRTHAATVYTPALVLNGREYRAWHRRDLADALRAQPATPRADISVQLHVSKSTAQISTNARVRDSTRAALYIALYENNLRSRVKAGENRGRTLAHAYVVRRLIGPLTMPPSDKLSAHESVALPADWKASDLGVAVFVQEARGTEILQALALDFCSASGARKRKSP